MEPALRRILALFSLLVTGPCSGTDPPAGRIGAEEYAVYSAVLDSLYADSTAALLVVADSSARLEGDPEYGDARAVGGLRGVGWRMERRFARDNRLRTPLEVDRLRVRVPVVASADSTIHRLFSAPRGDGWDGFYRRYPGSTGRIELSRVVFSADSTRAALYVVRGCGFLCADGYAISLERLDGRWRVKEEALHMVS